MIRFVTSIAFANESELGWDPTIQRERIPEQVHSSPGGNSSEPEREQVDATRYRITAQLGMMDMKVPLSRQCTEPPGLSSTTERTH